MSESARFEVAILGSGCFWCTQAVFDQLRGVESVACGYSGGNVPNPTYEQVCSGQTGHAECVRIEFDPEVISFGDLLQIFFQTHDPTTPNRQGNDIGTQYRSVIFCSSESQREMADETINRLNEAACFSAPIVTEVTPADTFYEAEAYHQNYYASHPSQLYCASVIRPKLDKFVKHYRDLLKTEE